MFCLFVKLTVRIEFIVLTVLLTCSHSIVDRYFVAVCNDSWIDQKVSKKKESNNLIFKRENAQINWTLLQLVKFDKMKLETKSLICLWILYKCVWTCENVNSQRISLMSDEPPNATAIVRYKRYLDFIPKSRMFVSLSIKNFKVDFFC